MNDTCAALTCPCGCGKVIRYWHVADCPDDCNIEANDAYRSGPNPAVDGVLGVREGESDE